MKKVLTIAIVALLATATLFAGVSFSGRFRQGYTFAFEKDKDAAVSPWKTEEAKLVMKVADDNGLWTVNLKNVGALDSNDKWSANASFDLTKAFALGGIDLGDFSLALSLGANTKMTALSAYTDPTGNEYFKLKNNGSETIQLSTGYGNLVKFNIAVDPTISKTTVETTTQVKTPLTTVTGSGSTGDVTITLPEGSYVYTDSTTESVVEKEASVVLSVSSEPINGVAVAAAYAYNGWLADSFTGLYTEDGLTAKNMIGFSANVDVAKLVGLNFKLGVSVYDNIAFFDEDAKIFGKDSYNSFAAAISGGIDLVDAFVEFTMGNGIPVLDKTGAPVFTDKNEIDSYNNFGLNMQVNLNLVENLGLDVYYNIYNLAKAGDNFAVGGDVSYTFAGVEFALNAEYARTLGTTIAKNATEGTFSLTPKMIIVF